MNDQHQLDNHSSSSKKKFTTKIKKLIRLCLRLINFGVIYLLIHTAILILLDPHSFSEFLYNASESIRNFFDAYIIPSEFLNALFFRILPLIAVLCMGIGAIFSGIIVVTATFSRTGLAFWNGFAEGLFGDDSNNKS